MGAFNSLMDKFKSKDEETADRARESERNLRALKVRALIDEYTDNN